MSRKLCPLSLFLTLAMTFGCRPPAPPDAPLQVAPGVPWELAEHRRQVLSEVRYELFFSIPASLEEPIQGRQVVSFKATDPAVDAILDFAQPEANVSAVRAKGQPVPWQVKDEHLIVPGAAVFGEDTGEREDASLEIDFVAGDGSLNRHADFLYTLFVPDRARVAFPVFDQPDLKARYRLTLEVPGDWEAVSNGELHNRSTVSGSTAGRRRYEFQETPPISSYLFSFAAGRFQVETAPGPGRPMRMYHRETDGAKVERNRQAIFDLHSTALDWLEEYCGTEYPFGKFDFVLIPAFQYSGMEHPGAILYRDTSLLLEESATQDQMLRRASLIAHETAHMWFGDLVTMTWFDDVWMKEVFANFMAAKIVHPSFPHIDHDLRFLLAHYPAAYDVDRTSGANPIRQRLDNLNQAGTLYGAVIYQKAPIVMKHLEVLLGEEPFRQGVREYLDAYRFGNASWPDLVKILDGKTDEDLLAWSRVWVEEAGRPTITTRPLVAHGELLSLRLEQADGADRREAAEEGGSPAAQDEPRLWNQQLGLVLGYASGSPGIPETAGDGEVLSVRLKERTMEVKGALGRRAPDFVLANGRGLGYGHFVLDDSSRTYLLRRLPTLADPLWRAVAWIALWEAMLAQEMEPTELFDLLIRALSEKGSTEEKEELILQRILGFLTETYWRYLSPEQRQAVAPGVEELLWQRLNSTPRKTLKASYFAAYRNLVLTVSGVRRLERIWTRQEPPPGLSFSQRDYTDIAEALALRRPDAADEILETQLGRIDNPDRQARFRFVMPALSADPQVRDGFFHSLADPVQRQREPWALDALRFLHHPLRAAESEKYIRPSLEMLPEIQRTGDIFFPKRWLDATLSGHQSSRAAEIVTDFLRHDTQAGTLPPRLRGKLLQSADPVFRAARILAREP